MDIEDRQQFRLAALFTLGGLLVAATITIGCVKGCEHSSEVDKAAIEKGYIKGPGNTWVMPSSPVSNR